ncbi:UDP-2,4-diacetamido-2,4,6-trideoxy-beta-L-altropyranose hydrolase [Francisella sciaenopsi]|uniref:UDP-2,4-diacetamido-2,4, 6-trideoxy-beta-L-altropyranose hydrolase n=1 Tax=Francisella sciaenopsi TaxID=3055034 RepID=A0ABQ6PHK5_9GAMM
MKAIIRVDSSSSIGTGHIMRDLVLASQFDDVTFVTRDLSGNINFKIIEAGYSVEIVKDNDLSEFVEVVEKLSPNLVILDNYNLDYDFERAFKEKYQDIKLMVLDDTYEKHYCDILLNHNIYAKSSDYISLVPLHCEVRCGAKYTLLRDEFFAIRDVKKTKKEYLRIFLGMGGADSQNMNIKVLDFLSSLNVSYRVDVVTTRSNKNLSTLLDYAQKQKNVRVYVDTNNLVKIVSNNDIAIITPSVMANEILFLKIPIITVMVASNQRYMYDFLRKNGIPGLKKSELDKLEELVKKFQNKEFFETQLSNIENIIEFKK